MLSHIILINVRYMMHTHNTHICRFGWNVKCTLPRVIRIRSNHRPKQSTIRYGYVRCVPLEKNLLQGREKYVFKNALLCQKAFYPMTGTKITYFQLSNILIYSRFMFALCLRVRERTLWWID